MITGAFNSVITGAFNVVILDGVEILEYQIEDRTAGIFVAGCVRCPACELSCSLRIGIEETTPVTPQVFSLFLINQHPCRQPGGNFACKTRQLMARGNTLNVTS